MFVVVDRPFLLHFAFRFTHSDIVLPISFTFLGNVLFLATTTRFGDRSVVVAFGEGVHTCPSDKPLERIPFLFCPRRFLLFHQME